VRKLHILGLIVCLAGPGNLPVAQAAAELIIVNADIYTVNPAIARAQALAVENGRFIGVGGNVQIRALADARTVVIDARGRTIVPGFIDGHAHISGNSPHVAGVDISYIADKKEWLKIIQAAHVRMPKDEWITGGGWDHTLSDGKYPTRQMLDSVAPDRPVVLNHIDGHYAWANTRALQMAGITAKTPVPAGGEIVLDTSGEPTGILLEGAQDLVRRLVPPRPQLQRRENLAKMVQYANSFGVTGVHQMGGLDDYLHIIEQGDPTLRVWYGQFGPRAAASQFDAGVQSILAAREDTAKRVAAAGKEGRIGPLLQLGYVKLFNDGVLSSHTAVLLEDYADRAGWKGEYVLNPPDLRTQVQKITAAGLPVAVHSIGDAAVRATLDAYEAARSNATPYPNRIEHIEMLHPDDVRRFRALGVVASMQPNHATNSFAYNPARMGAARENRAFVWNSLLSQGVPLVFGADYHTSPLNPLVQIADAVFRTSPFGFLDGKPWHPEQALSFEQALHAYTQAGANITAWKDQIGSITTGKWADFVLLDGKVPAPMNQSFRKLTVDKTWFAGREVYSK
jgi:predicted amidohydrolase YtcJ